MKTNTIILWVCRLVAAGLLLQTLFFKFSAAPESVYIFTKVGIEPWGRIGTGVAELIAGILILLPRTSVIGAVMAIGIMAGALATHLFILGIEVMGDRGQLFIYALIITLCSLYITIVERQRLLSIIKTKKL